MEWFLKYRSGIRVTSTFFTHLLPNGKRCNWILRDVCFDSWSSGCRLMHLRLRPSPIMESWEHACYCNHRYHCLDSYSLGNGVYITNDQNLRNNVIERSWSTDFRKFCRFGCKEIELQYRNAKLVAMESFSIILSVTQLLYIAALHGPSIIWRVSRLIPEILS